MIYSTVLVLVLALTSPVQEKADKKVDETGFIVDKGLIMVKANCTSCHGPKLIQQNRADAEGWKAIIRTMQKEHGLWQMAPEIEKQVIDYLARNYKPEKRGRRKPLDVPKAWLN
ncbi:MAG: hypothetical protein QNK37_08660 [Acidobacteriota bacterium]|nr:hypothetical protein [Acidobacteriota bacterium]